MASKFDNVLSKLTHGHLGTSKDDEHVDKSEGRDGHVENNVNGDEVSTEIKEKGKDKKGEGDDGDDEPEPEGGHDTTLLHPTPGEVYTVQITFHRATNLPVTDYDNMLTDAYIFASIDTSLPRRHPKQDPQLRHRTTTKHSTVNPEWEESWIVAGLPSDGFLLKARFFDEDQADHDDRLGVAYVSIPSLSSSWEGISNQPFEIKKRRASQRANLSRTIAHLTHPIKRRHAGAAQHSDRTHYESLYLSVKVLSPTPEKENLGKAYTVGPCVYRIHYSPLIGRLMGMKQEKEQEKEGEVQSGKGDEDGEGAKDGKDGEKDKAGQYDFQANEMQFPGPVPNQLYHRFVDFSSFVNGMFNKTGPRGRILNKALHHQHARLYNFDKRTVIGTFDQGPCEAMTRKFLDMAHFDQGGRMFTYVLTSDALLRFTETGKEFGIDLLSKHTMHSDVNVYIAWSGEFLIRRRSQGGNGQTNETHPPHDSSKGDVPKDIKLYELIIDNDSGTYRPNKDLIPIFEEFMERSLPGLHIKVYNGFDKELEHIKEEQREIKKRDGDGRIYTQNGYDGSDLSSISSSDEDDLSSRAESMRLQDGKSSGGQSNGGGFLQKEVAFLEDPVAAIKRKF